MTPQEASGWMFHLLGEWTALRKHLRGERPHLQTAEADAQFAADEARYKEAAQALQRMVYGLEEVCQ